MARPADLPFTEHFQQMACGTRAKYVGGRCRCMLCRAANSRYETERALARKNGDGNGLVSAERARAHLLWLSGKGVGRRAVGASSDVGDTTLQKIRNGTKTQIRQRTERGILAVDQSCISDGALIDARPSWRKLRRLLTEGYPAARLCRFLGYKHQGLQFDERRITARNAQRIDRLYRELLALDRQAVA